MNTKFSKNEIVCWLRLNNFIPPPFRKLLIILITPPSQQEKKIYSPFIFFHLSHHSLPSFWHPTIVAHSSFDADSVFIVAVESSPSSCSIWCSATYNFGSILFGIGLISVCNSCSIRCNEYRSSYVIKLMAIPKWPKRPERPILCKDVSALRGKIEIDHHVHGLDIDTACQ